ncbi:hypothetical protein AMATHDRAFT_68800 [Amanita thiersii Skay4041]|uniref:thioredoxin-dependent peroxiredoxin n=1 Tax=Amanita thiersii Skay4041 TaxID=703135 RepID=A0A2A9NGR6_9AGAR|nr:hypothetical protein AMATHDRAFT_68800 [Amanita thiersii Skay4041]
MPPRKAPVDPADAPPPRRSSRISAQTGETKATPPAAAVEKNTARKRGAVDPGDREGVVPQDESTLKSKKKAKSTAKEAVQEAEEDEGEEAVEPEPEPLAPIDVGDTLPSLTLKNEKDEDVQVAEIAAQKGVVLFLVPKADTPGCTNQACGFRDIYQEFTDLGYDVYCLSADTPAAQTKWQTKKELPYHLLSDGKRVLISALGAGEGGKTKRSHFVFEKGGKLVDKKIPVKPVDSPKLALEFIKSQGSN